VSPNARNLVFLKRVLAALVLAHFQLCVYASERIALVIGNSNYRQSPLANPKNDASDMAALLTKAGFQVDTQIDADIKQMQSAVARFGTAVRDPRVKFGLFYFAGHGLQQNWRNYIVPTSATIRQASDVLTQTVDVSELLRYMEQPQNQRSFLVILDACRDNPFADSYQPSAKGLSQFDAPVGSLLAFATSPGNYAQDGAGKNGLYTSYLLREFAVPGVRIEDAFKRVRLSVRLASKGAQIPWESTSLEEDIYLFPIATPKLSEADRDKLLEREIATWLTVKSSNDPSILGEFIREFPSGSASELAQSRLSRLLAQQRAADNDRVQRETAAAAQAAKELAEQETLAKLKAQEMERQRLQALAAENERIRLAKLEAAKEEERKQQAAAIATGMANAAKAAAELALAAELEIKRIAAEKAQAAILAAAQLAAQRQAQAARQSELKAAQAAQEFARMATAQAEKEAQEKALAQQAEAARLLALKEAQDQQLFAEQLALEKQKLLLAATATPQAITIAPTPHFKGYSEHLRRYSVGDEYHIRVIDQFTKYDKPLDLKVTELDVNAERVTYNNGEFVSDLMGNITTNQRGSLSTPRQFYPAELFIGKKWQTRFKQTRPNGTTYTFAYDLKVTGKERITVPAGTFDTYKIEARGYNMELGARLERDIWVAPGVNADIAHEIRVRLRNGAWDQNDRQELVAYRQRD
jgi:hypothetical protein